MVKEQKKMDVSGFHLPPDCLHLRDQEAFIECIARAGSLRNGSEDQVILYAEGDHD